MTDRIACQNPSLASLLGATVVFTFCLIQTPAMAQTDAVSEDDGAVEEIIVTGSRLRRRDFSSPSPIATIDRETLDYSGQGTLESTLNQMPQITPDIDRAMNNGSDGTARVNLRGLGAHRTLVMLNGRRLAPSGIGTAVDVNNLPQVLIDRAEIMTGGATTVYGSDAVAGVINFITRSDFEGFSVDLSGYATERGDSNIYDINLTYGHNFSNGRGNITLFGGYYDREETFADSRELTSVPWFDTWEGELIQGGSSRVPDGAVLFPEADLGNGPVRVIFDADGNPREFISPDDLYNWAPENYLQTPLRRQSVGLFLNYDLTDRTQLYVEGAFSRNEHRAVLAPVPAGGFLDFTVNNPIMTAATQQLFADNYTSGDPNMANAFITRRLEELGPRIIENRKDYLRVVAGLQGDIWTDWEFDAWVSYTDADEPEFLLNDGSGSRLQQGLLVDPNGECTDTSNGCVPVNIFGAGNMSPEAVNFIRLPPLKNATTREQMLASAFVRGKLFSTWAGPVESAFGLEWRRDDGGFTADDYLFTGDTLGYRGASPVLGQEDVYEIYAEMLLPLAEGRPFADYLALEVGGRWSEYEHAGDVSTWKVGLEWRPVAAVLVRSMYQRSVRAPNLLEAFEEQATEIGTYAVRPEDDPCSTASDPVAAGNVEKCIATGLPADQIGLFNAGPFPTAFITGGNPDLEPEIADTFTLGIVISPDAIPDLQISVDYFDLQVEGGIGDLNASSTCFDSANVNNLFCDAIKRDPSSFNVSEVRETTINRGLLKTTGFDTQIAYSFDLPDALAIGDSYADLKVSVAWTHVQENSFQGTAFGTVIDCAGHYGWPCTENGTGVTFPIDRITANLNYGSGDLTAHLTWRWIDKTKNAAPFLSGDFGFPDPDLAIPYVKAKSYVDLGIGYQFNEHIVARLIVANLADTKPPNMADAVFDKNTDTSMYDIFGRSYTLSFSLNY